MGKVRHVNFYPDEWLAGASVLKADERGCYITVCALIYSRGGPIPDDARDLAKLCNVTAEKWQRIRSVLLARGKLYLEDGCLTNRRCETELKRALKRSEESSENGVIGGIVSGVSRRNRKVGSNDNNDLSEADASGGGKLTKELKNQQTNPPNPQKGAGIDADFERWYQAYPKKVARGAAVKAYRAARAKAEAETLLNAADAFARSVAGKDEKYIPHPATWLNGERWRDGGQSAPSRQNQSHKDLDAIPMWFDDDGKPSSTPKPRPQLRDIMKDGKY